MQHECRITVLETKVFDDYQEKYLANPKSGPCPCFKKGDTFLLKSPPERDDFYHMLNGKFSVSPIGKDGMEQALEQYLRGTDGKRVVSTNEGGKGCRQ